AATAAAARGEAVRSRFAAARRAAAADRPAAIPARTADQGPGRPSLTQARLWFLWRLEPDSPAYNAPVFVRLTGPVDTAALEDAVRGTVSRHEVLRTVFEERDGEPALRVLPPGSVPFLRRDVARVDLDRELDAEAAKPFAVDTEPPMRATLLRTTDDEHVLALAFHHIVVDAGSVPAVLTDIAAGYAARTRSTPTPAAPRLQYADIAQWEADRTDASADTDLDWWATRLAGLPPLLDVPTDRPRPPVADVAGAGVPITVPPALTARLRAVAAEAGCTPFMVLLGVWQALLGRWAGVEDVAVGVPESGRHHPDMEDVVGCFINTLVLRGDLAGDPTGRELLARARGQVLDALGHAQAPLERIVERLGAERSLAGAPVFQVMLNVLETPVAVPAFAGLDAELLLPATRSVKFDLTLDLANAGEEYRGQLTYRADLFDGATAERAVGWYLSLLEGVLTDLDAPVGTVALEPVAGPLLAGPSPEGIDPRPVHVRFEDWAMKTPDAVAVVAADGDLTFGELDARANRIAHCLRAAGVGPDQPVGVLLESGADLACALLGIMKSGGAYLPFDTTYPTGRIHTMLAAAGAKVVVTTREAALRSAIEPDYVSVPLDEPGTLEAWPDTCPDIDFRPDQLIHVVFTSGSTGAPKGVAVEHRNVMNYLSGILDRLGDEVAGGSFAMVSTPAADFGLTCVFGALTTGGTVHLVERETAMDPAAFAGYLERHNVDVLKCVPSHLELLAAHGDLSSVLPRRLLILAGEACPWSLVERIGAARPGLRVQNHYGHTESTMISLTCETSEVPVEQRHGVVPLGRPLPGVSGYLVDRSGRPVPPGIPGELVIGGPGVSRGYLNDPERTAERFTEDPLGDGERCYRSGDLLRVLNDGTIEFRGRVDDQVKIRGYRVELGEIVTALRTLPQIAEAVVLPIGEGHERRLAAWIVPATGPVSDPAVLRAELRTSLPDYMIPATITVLERLPLNPNGKIDRAALPAPTLETTGTKTPPSTPTEHHIAQAWAAVLEAAQTATIGAEDDFFALGGHSFTAARVVGRLSQALGRTIPLRLLFERPVLADLAAALDGTMAADGPDPAGGGRADSVAAGIAADPAAGEIGPRDAAAATGRLSPTQARLWLLAQLDPDSAAYNVDMVLRLTGPLAVDALSEAVRDIAERHEVLRTVFVDDGGDPAASVLPADSVPFAVEDLAGTSDAGRLERRLAEQSRRPFDLGAEPPMRGVLFRLGDDEHVLALTFHHIATDNWSRGLIGEELAQLYRARSGSEPTPDAPRLQYADVVEWEAARSDAPGETDLDWWTERLAGLAPTLDLPTDRPRPAVAGVAGGAVPVTVPAALTARLRAVAAEAGCTPFMVLLGVWQALLGRWAGVEDVAVGVPESGRHHPDMESVVGCFINTLVLRGDLAGDPTGRELLARARGQVLDALGHPHAPLEQIVERLQPERSLAATPLFQVMLNVLDSPAAVPTLPGLAVEQLERGTASVKFDLTLALVNTGDAYLGELTYRADLFDGATAERAVGWYLSLLEGVLTDLDAPVGKVALEPVTGPALSGGPRLPAGDVPLPGLIERWADQTPDAVAVVAADGDLTFGELDARANRIAHRLRAAGVGPDQPVGVLLESGADLACALLGIMKSGGAYLPFDTTYPTGRIHTMLAAAGASVVLTYRDVADRHTWEPHHVVVLLDTDEVDAWPTTRPEPDIRPDQLIHVVFTSGSTGAPKGVAVEHRNVLNYLHAILQRLGPEVAGGSFAMVSTPAADFGLTCVFGALTTGGTVHLVERETAMDPAAFATYLEQHNVDVLKCVPSHLELLAAHGDLASVLPDKLLILAGEACPWSLVERINAARPDLRVQNHYGHTESTMISLTCETTEIPIEQRHGVVPLGRPLPGVTGYLVDRSGTPVPPGIPGELVIGGPGVSRGYLNDPERTAERFTEDPLGDGERCYRSGDLLRVLNDGTVEFRGRVDDQVKIRGYRVELGEIVTALRTLPQIAEAVVLPVGEAHERRLAAWIVPATGQVPDTAVLRAELRTSLPDYMIPATITILERLPLNPNGKIDRAALPTPEPETTGVKTPPSTPTEHHIVQAWAQVLDHSDIGVDDDFFALGGNSFAAVRAVRAIGHGVRLIDLFGHPTPRALAAHIDRSEQSGDDADAARPLLHRMSGPLSRQSAGTVPPTVVCVPYGGGSAAVFKPLAEALGDRAVVQAVELPGHDPARPGEPLRTLGDLVDTLTAEVEATVTGPVVLYGHCVGSALATALAQRLEERGRPVLGVVVAGSLPAARLGGRLSAWLDRTFPRKRRVSDRLFRDTLRATGGLPDDTDDTTVDTVLHALRHDSEQAQAWFGGILAAEDGTPRIAAPILCLVGEQDRATELYEERYGEWTAFAERVELASIPAAGHYFLRHQAAATADLLADRCEHWAARSDEPSAPGTTAAATTAASVGIIAHTTAATAAEAAVTGEARRRGLRAFFTVAAGQTVSTIGNALSSFALGVWAYQHSGRVGDLAMVVLLAQIPVILLSPAGGALADRVDRRRIMLACDAVAGLAMVALVLLMARDELALWNVCLVVGVTSATAAFRTPAYLAGIAQLVPKPYLPQANALAQAGTGLGSVVGPLAGGALIALLGLTWVVAVDVASFAVGAATLLAVRFPDRLFAKRQETFRSAVTGGWRFIARRRPMALMAGFFAVVNYFTALMWVAVPPLVLSIGSPAALGAVTAAGGLGAAAGAAAVVMWGGTRRRAIGMVGFVIGSGAGVILMGLWPSVALVAVGLAVRLACMSVGNAHWMSIIQTKVGHELQGRVLAANMMLATLMQPLGFLTAGPLAEHVFQPLVSGSGPLAGSVGRVVGDGTHGGVALMLAASGLALIGWGVLGLAYSPLRRMEDALPDAVPGATIAADLDAVQQDLDAAQRGLDPAMTR
ncbi:non-ribosomal peptide synthetase/MFS transporter, partial [Actinomadura harenae]